MISVPDAEGAGVEDVQSLLDRIDREDATLAADLLASELDHLLGRKPPAPEPTLLNFAEPRKPRGKSSRFEWYAQMVGVIPLLDPERTKRAAQSVEIGLLAEERLANIDKTTATRREIVELHTLADHGRDEFQLLVVSNLRLVFHWSKGVASSIDDDWAQDAFQAGCMGLMRGLRGWDQAKGFALSTYVSWHIRQAIQRWRANEVLLIRLPVHVWEGLDSASGLTPEVRAAAVRAQNIYSLDEMDVVSADLVWDGGLEERALSLDRIRLISALLGALNEKEVGVLRLRFGLDEMGDEPMTLDAIGEILGVTRERIRQIEKKGLDRLRGLVSNPGDWHHLT